MVRAGGAGGAGVGVVREAGCGVSFGSDLL